MVSLLKERFVCVQEIIPGAETRPADLSAERRKLLERFAHNDRFFFGKIRLLSPDGKDVLGDWRSFPGADEASRKKEGEQFLAVARDVLAGKEPQGSSRPPFLKEGPRFKKDGPKSRGPKVGERAPDFELKLLGTKDSFKLSSNFDKRATVLIFHSFT